MVQLVIGIGNVNRFMQLLVHLLVAVSLELLELVLVTRLQQEINEFDLVPYVSKLERNGSRALGF